MAIALDSSVLIALANTFDVHHTSCRDKVVRTKYRYRASVLAYLEALYSGFRESYETALLASLELIESLDEIVDVNFAVATKALELVAKKRFEMADSVICATAEIYGDELWTCDKAMASKFPAARYIGE
jgi:predicted nucleic acid-binding protein